MPKREELLVNNFFYHIYNKTIDGKEIFKDEKYCRLFLQILKYYRSSKSKISFSEFNALDEVKKEQILKKINIKKYYQIEIISYCLMPTHFHLLIKQRLDNGIVKCIANTINSFTRIFNLKEERKGPLFIPRFKAVLIRTEEQLKHLSRYIHLNPYSNGFVKNINELINFKWSSLKNYIYNFKDDLCNNKEILILFDNDKLRYKKFIQDNADYQKFLEKIKYLNEE